MPIELAHILIALVISITITFILGYMITLFIWAKSWIYREPMPRPDSIGFILWLDRLTIKELSRHDSIVWLDYFVMLFLSLCCTFLGLLLAVLSYHFLPMRLIALTTMVIVGGMHALRYSVDIKTAVEKAKQTVHEHASGSEPEMIEGEE